MITSDSPTFRRRRSQRVAATLPVFVRWISSEGFHVTALGKSKVFNAHGGLLLVRSPMTIPPEVELVGPNREEILPARVVARGEFSPIAPMHLAVEFDIPSETFWGVPIPPMPPDATG